MVALPAMATDMTAEHRKHHRDRVFHIKGVQVTGINDLCGESIWTFDYPAPLPPDFRTPNFGIYDPRPGATDAIPLTPENCRRSDAVIATTIDPIFANFLGLPATAIDKRLLNLPVRSVPMPVFFDGIRSTVPSLKDVPRPAAVDLTLSGPSEPITLGQWFRARGDLTIRCDADGSADVFGKFRNLIPNGVYTVWGSWRTTPSFAPIETVMPIPFGGAPNSVIADHEGNATFVRNFAYCPMDPINDAVGSKLLFVALVYHPDGVLYGAAPGPFIEQIQFRDANGSEFTSAAIPGVLIQDQLIFNITGTRIRK
jgi:hypothetical protein